MPEHNFIFDKWFDSLLISKDDDDIHDNYENTLIDLLENEIDASRFISSYNLIIDDIGIINKDENDKYFFDIQIQKIGDIITDFIVYPYYHPDKSTADIKMNLKVNDNFLPIKKNTKLINSIDNDIYFKIRITFDNKPFNVKLIYLSYVFQNEIRDDLIKKIKK